MKPPRVLHLIGGEENGSAIAGGAFYFDAKFGAVRFRAVQVAGCVPKPPSARMLPRRARVFVPEAVRGRSSTLGPRVKETYAILR
jgi:hypothetical protein